MRVSEVMNRDARVIPADMPISEAAIVMRDSDLGFLPVEAEDKMAGMLTDRDIVVRVVADGRNPAEMTARDAMTPEVRFCYEDQECEEAAQMMREAQVRRMPVVDRDKRLVGILSMNDLSKGADKQEVGRTEAAIAR